MTNQQARIELHAALQQAHAQRERAHKIEGIVGGILFGALGSCVLAAIVLWLTR